MEKLKKCSKNELLDIIMKLNQINGKKLEKQIIDIMSTFKRIIGVKISIMEEIDMIIEMSKEDYLILLNAINKGYKKYIGACCGQTRCQICRLYGEIEISRNTMIVTFMNDLSEDDLNESIDSRIEENIYEIIDDFKMDEGI